MAEITRVKYCAGRVPLPSRPDQPCPRTDYVLEVRGGCLHEHMSQANYCSLHAPVLVAKLATEGHPLCRLCLYGSEPHECDVVLERRTIHDFS